MLVAKKSKLNFAGSALVKARELQELIDTLNTTTVGSLSSDISQNTDDIAIINNKLNAIASVLGITFNVNGTLSSESYTSHTHSYKDATIDDTVDGTGTQTDTTRTTQGVS